MHVNDPSLTLSPRTLYLVATPIGNLRDITLRALDVLKAADIVLCEDTRVTQKLLTAYGIKARLLPYHDKNGEEMRPKILQLLAENKTLALVSDAGAPMISDPGYRLGIAVKEAGYKIEALPGASAVITALQLSGLPTDRFLFAGFMPRKDGERATEIARYRGVGVTLVFFEAPSRLLDTLGWLSQNAPDTQVAIARELTKRFEEITSGTPQELLANYEARKEGVLGEIVLCLRFPAQEITEESIDAALISAMQEMRLKEAAQFVAEQFDLPKNQVYTRALALKDKA